MTARAIYNDWRRNNDPMRDGWDDLSGSDRQMLESMVERAKEDGAAEEREACAAMVQAGDGATWDDQGISAAIRARST